MILDTLPHLIQVVQSQPWIGLVPLVVLALSNGALGYLVARKRGEAFSWARFADFMQNSVGAHQLAWVAGSIVLVYLSQGQTVAWASVLALAGVHGIAYAKVLEDDYSKVQVLLNQANDPKALH